MAWDESQRPSLTYRQARLNVSEKRTKLNIALSQCQLDKSIRFTIYEALGILLLTLLEHISNSFHIIIDTPAERVITSVS